MHVLRYSHGIKTFEISLKGVKQCLNYISTEHYETNWKLMLDFFWKQQPARARRLPKREFLGIKVLVYKNIILASFSGPYCKLLTVTCYIFCGRWEQKIIGSYIPLISRVRGPYSKLWTEFFPSFYCPSAKRAGHKNKEGKKRGSITCRTDRANEANKMFIIWLCWLFRFWKGDQEQEVRTATYGPGIDQSQHAKSCQPYNKLTYGPDQAHG